METWKPIPGYGTRYLVSNQGRVYSNITNKIMTGGRDRYGYRIVTLSLDGKQTTHKVHGLVCELFCGPRPKGGCVCHANDIRNDNRAENLSWGTPAENSAQMRERNRSLQGARNHEAKLTHFQVFMIRTTPRERFDSRSIAAFFGLSFALISSRLSPSPTSI